MIFQTNFLRLSSQEDLKEFKLIICMFIKQISFKN
jgi:hypothetical protein